MLLEDKKEAILIGFGESLSAPEVAWDLLEHKFRVVAFYRSNSLPPIRHLKEIRLENVIAPEKDAWKTIEKINKICKLHDIKVLLPLDDASIWLCNMVASINKNVLIAGASGENAKLALDKSLQLEAAIEAGFNVPNNFLLVERSNLLNINQLPVVIKPADAIIEVNGKLCKGPVIFCMDEKDLIKFINECDYEGRMLVQPFLAGIGEGIFGLSGPYGVKNWSVHRRLRTVNPLGSGSSACKSIKITDHPIGAAEKMIKKTNWQGMFMIELLRDKNNKLWFMELNGRAWGSMALALRLGLHYPAWTVKQTLDSTFEPPPPPPWESVTCRHLGREILHVISVLKGERTFKLMPNYSRMKTLLEVCRFSNNEKWYNKYPGHNALFWEDTIKTVLKKIFSI